MAVTTDAKAIAAILAQLHHMELHQLPREDAYQVELLFVNGLRCMTPITLGRALVEDRHSPTTTTIMADIVHSALRSGARTGVPWFHEVHHVALQRPPEPKPEPPKQQKLWVEGATETEEFNGILKAVYGTMPMEQYGAFAEWAQTMELRGEEMRRAVDITPLLDEVEPAPAPPASPAPDPAAEAALEAAIEADVLAALGDL